MVQAQHFKLCKVVQHKMGFMRHSNLIKAPTTFWLTHTLNCQWLLGKTGACKPSATSSEETLLHSLQVAVTRELGNQHK